MTINLFKVAYKVVRDNSDTIYKGFGFKHHSDATQYYVHPNNQSFNGTTTLCQPIGEAVVMMSLLYQQLGQEGTTPVGNYYADGEGGTVFLRLDIPADWHKNGVVEPEVHHYLALLEDDEISLCAYDDKGQPLSGNMDHLHPRYKLLPCFCVLLARECATNEDFSTMLRTFAESPAADAFANIHEDFYQAHKLDEYDVEYTDVSGYDYSELHSFADTFLVVAENKQEIAAAKVKEIKVIPFAKDAFPKEYRPLIPHLGEELVIQPEVKAICNAVQAGDALSVLFHGPAGTGKTISCKLVCQEIGLPIMDVINCTENLDEFVLGKYIPQEDKIIFQESFVTKAVRSGGAVVFEEINFAKPQYLAFLNSLLDDNGFIRLDNGEVVRRHPNFRFFATMNLGYFGTKELNQALYNRFNIVLELANLSDDAIRKMLTTRVPECEAKVEKILGVYHKLKGKINSEELDLVISPRNLENWARLAKHEGYLTAAEKTIIPIAKCDRAMEEAIRGILLLYKWS